MNFPIIEIADPAAVGVWLDHVIPEDPEGMHLASYDERGWHALHWVDGSMITGRGANPEALLADLKAKIADRDPVAEIRKQAEALGFELKPLATV